MANKKHDKAPKKAEPNRDPISGAKGAHPVGTGVGAARGGVAGAALGSAAGPIGAGVGLVAGAVAGGLAGKGVAEKFDPTMEDAYWEANYLKRPYVDRTASYDVYRPAFRTGYEGRGRHRDQSFEEAEADLRRDYERTKGSATLSWDKAKPAARDAWDRLETAIPGDADDDGR